MTNYLPPSDATAKMNILGQQRQPFFFMISFDCQKAIVLRQEETLAQSDQLLFQLPQLSNFPLKSKAKKHSLDYTFDYIPISYDNYYQKFFQVQSEIKQGNTYLLNLTAESQVISNLTLFDIFHYSNAKYKLYWNDEFVVFSPESFIQIRNNKISTFPMKGTIDADLENAQSILLNDQKEKAEHASIVDLLRNDLSIVAKNVKVKRYRYFDYVQTSQKNLWQISSEIEGELSTDYYSQIGNIIYQLLPAGSISGVPKKATQSIISRVEDYDRGFYTGIFGYFDGQNLDSAVMIRFIEKTQNGLIYKSGGGIHSLSDPITEYNELNQKIYVPIPRNPMYSK